MCPVPAIPSLTRLLLLHFDCKEVYCESRVVLRDMELKNDRFGVSRVFSQQCGYVLTDMQNLRDKMRGITMLLKELEVDPDVVTTR